MLFIHRANAPLTLYFMCVCVFALFITSSNAVHFLVSFSPLRAYCLATRGGAMWRGPFYEGSYNLWMDISHTPPPTQLRESTNIRLLRGTCIKIKKKTETQYSTRRCVSAVLITLSSLLFLLICRRPAQFVCLTERLPASVNNPCLPLSLSLSPSLSLYLPLCFFFFLLSLHLALSLCNQPTSQPTSPHSSCPFFFVGYTDA